MPPKKEPLDTKGKKDILRGLKKHLSKEILEDSFTAADQAYLEYWTAEKLKQINVLKDQLEKKTLENDALKSALQETKDLYKNQATELRNNVNMKCEKVTDLTEQNHFLQKERDSELKFYEKELFNERQRYKRTKERLLGDVKMLNGKLNYLKQFRDERDALVEKHDEIQKHLHDLEERAAAIVNVYQRLELITRERMGQELKDRLLKLSLEFQEASQTETTRSLIRENIAINNELGMYIGSWQTISDENSDLKTRIKVYNEHLKIERNLNKKCLSLNVLQTQVIERLAYEHKKLDMYHEETEGLKDLNVRLEKKLENLTAETTAAELKANLLLQEKHNLMTQCNELEHDCTALNNIIYEEEINLKKALLYVAEGQDLRARKEKLKLTSDELRNKLMDILKNLAIFLKDTKLPWNEDMARDLSVATIYDPDYAQKYWRGLGIIIERKSTAKSMDDKEVTPSKDDASSDDDSD